MTEAASIRGRVGRTVLAVEDEALLLDILSAELKDRSYNVLPAATGEIALSLLHDSIERIDLVVTDIRLPGKVDGWAVAEEARRLRADIPVIYVTGYSGHISREVQGSVLIAKPYRPSAIVAAAARLGVAPA